MATPSTDVDRTRGLRDRPLGRVAILLAILVAAFLASRSCASNESEIDSDRAVEIARGAIAFDATGVQVKNLPKGLKRRIWAVRLYTGPATAPVRCRIVEVDPESGAVGALHRC